MTTFYCPLCGEPVTIELPPIGGTDAVLHTCERYRHHRGRYEAFRADYTEPVKVTFILSRFSEARFELVFPMGYFDFELPALIGSQSVSVDTRDRC